MSLFSRGAMCVPLAYQENIICTLPSHFPTRTVIAICEGKIRTAHVWLLYAKGTLCGSTFQCLGTSFSPENKRDYEWRVSGAHPYIFFRIRTSA